VKGADAWPITPVPFDPASPGPNPGPTYDTAHPGPIGPEIDGALPAPPTLPPVSEFVAVASDGTLYLEAGSNPRGPLVPDPISEADLSALTLGDALQDGIIPRELWSDVDAPSDAAPAAGVPGPVPPIGGVAGTPVPPQLGRFVGLWEGHARRIEV